MAVGDGVSVGSGVTVGEGVCAGDGVAEGATRLGVCVMRVNVGTSVAAGTVAAEQALMRSASGSR